jgi:hypothetical protein
MLCGVRGYTYVLFHLDHVYFCSCALVEDNCVSVWDIRRPYIPHAQFTKHQCSITGISPSSYGSSFFNAKFHANLLAYNRP